jgi:hypothetical protein
MTAEGVVMRITRAADWVVFSTSRFDEHVAYMRDVLGMPIESQGPAVVDRHFLRYVLFALPGGVTLEVVEPSPEFAHFHDVTIVCFTVDDLSEGLRELAARQQTPISPVFTHGMAGVGPICGCQTAASTSFKAASHSSRKRTSCRVDFTGLRRGELSLSSPPVRSAGVKLSRPMLDTDP